MILQVWRYKSAFPAMSNIYKNNAHKPLDEILGCIAVATHIPIVACSYYLEDIVGKSEEMDKIRNRLINFYRYLLLFSRILLNSYSHS